MTPASAVRRDGLRRLTRRLGGSLACLAGLFLLAADGKPAPLENNPADKRPDAADAPPAPPAGRLIRVPLPIVGNADTHVIAATRKALADMPAGGGRPVLVLEFSGSANQTGQGSDFERSLKLARHLSSREASAAKTVAYIPRALKGHAVLAAMACEEIVMAPEAVIGEAGLDEPPEEMTDPTVRSGYREIANRRRTIPAEVALAMLDKSLELLKVEIEVSPEFVLRQDLEALKAKHTIQSEQVLSPPGQFALFNGREARELGFVKYLAADRAALARALSLPPEALEDDPSLSGAWRPVRVALEGPITTSLVSRIQRTVEKQIRDHKVNFICLWIDSPGGSLTDSMNLANYLADQDPGQVRIVAYVPTKARADAALVAMAADQLVMNHDAVLGGEGDAQFSSEDLELARETLKDNLAPKTARSWSLTAALVDPQVRVFRYTNKRDGAAEYFCEEELKAQAEAENWQQGPEVTRAGEPLRVTGDRAGELGMARHVVQDFADFKQVYALEGELALAEPSWADYLIDALAAPAVAWLLLLIGGAALYAELQAPGIGIGGFIAGICFLLYFWSKHLDGTAGWLEVLLFAAGVCCILLELFVLPGAGIFGLGGGLMIIASLVLASQTFIVPHNEYQMRELRDSLLGLLAVGVGIGVVAMVMRRYLPHTPLFSNMMLEPPSNAELADIAHREAMVDFEHLLGHRGVATTQLTPSGKARFGNKLVDVIADGEVISRGTEVVVTEVHGNRVVVQSAAGRV
jgi:membrane-bound ClpP family serine protease